MAGRAELGLCHQHGKRTLGSALQHLGMPSCPRTCPLSCGALQGGSQPGEVKHCLWTSMRKELECPGGLLAPWAIRRGRSSVPAPQSRC